MRDILLIDVCLQDWLSYMIHTRGSDIQLGTISSIKCGSLIHIISMNGKFGCSTPGLSTQVSSVTSYGSRHIFHTFLWRFSKSAYYRMVDRNNRI